MSVFLCISIISLAVFGADLRITVSADVDAVKNEYFAKIYVFRLSIMRVIISFIEFDIIHRYLWLGINGRAVGLALTADRSNADSILNYMSSPVLGAVDFRQFDLRVSVGSAENAFVAAMALQSIRTAFAVIVAYIRSRQHLAVREEFVMEGEKSLKLRFHGIISLTPANIIFSLLTAAGTKAARSKEVKVDSQ